MQLSGEKFIKSCIYSTNYEESKKELLMILTLKQCLLKVTLDKLSLSESAKNLYEENKSVEHHFENMFLR